jgi:uncharacterized protein
MELSNAFLGTGWAFPPQFDRAAKLPEMVSAVKDIEQSLNILLSTSIGERVMVPDYGCDLKNYLFESLNSSVIGYIKNRVTNAILFYEPRITAEKIDVTADDSSDLWEGKFTITVEYSIPGINSRFNYVYGFYQGEALQLP